MPNTTNDTTPAAPASQGRLIPLTQWNRFHTWPPVGGLRHLVFFADKNGFAACVKRVGGRVLIDESAFFQWADKQNAQASR